MHLGFKRPREKLSKREYKIRSKAAELDYAIAIALNSNILGHRQIKRTVEQLLGHIVYKSTLERHLKNMVEHGWVIKHLENWKLGKVLPYSLHPRAKQALRLDLFEPVVTTGRKKGIWTGSLSIEQKELRNFLFLLYLMVFKPPLANGYPRIPYDGISVDDVSYALNIGHPFGFTQLTTLHTLNILEKLRKENLIYVTQKDTKFYFIQSRMASLIKELFTILDNLILPRIEIDAKNTEATTYNFSFFYESVYGIKTRKRHFGKFHDLRMRYRTMQSKVKKENEEKIKKLIKYDDYNIFDISRRLDKTYRDLVEEQPFLVDAFLKAIVPPEFGKNPAGKRYPKIVMAGSSSS